MGRKVAVVTGGNRGLGLELVKQLCSEFDGDVILTSRMSDKGLAALENLKLEGLRPRFHELPAYVCLRTLSSRNMAA